MYASGNNMGRNDTLEKLKDDSIQKSGQQTP